MLQSTSNRKLQTPNSLNNSEAARKKDLKLNSSACVSKTKCKIEMVSNRRERRNKHMPSNCRQIDGKRSIFSLLPKFERVEGWRRRATAHRLLIAIVIANVRALVLAHNGIAMITISTFFGAENGNDGMQRRRSRIRNHFSCSKYLKQSNFLMEN